MWQMCCLFLGITALSQPPFRFFVFNSKLISYFADRQYLTKLLILLCSWVEVSFANKFFSSNENCRNFSCIWNIINKVTAIYFLEQSLCVIKPEELYIDLPDDSLACSSLLVSKTCYWPILPMSIAFPNIQLLKDV